MRSFTLNDFTDPHDLQLIMKQLLLVRGIKDMSLIIMIHNSKSMINSRMDPVA